MNEENKNPCIDCKIEDSCRRNARHKQCKAWLEWFHEQWQKIRKLFGVECVESTQEEKECDNEDS